MTCVAQWVLAHENFMGFWVGTFIACVLTYPGRQAHVDTDTHRETTRTPHLFLAAVLAQWPSSASWSMPQEVASAALRGVARVAGPRVTPALMAVFYSSMGVAILLWLDLVYLRPDPGTLRFDAQNFQDIAGQV